MRISRRSFLSGATTAVGSFCLSQARPLLHLYRRTAPERACVVLDVNSNCVLRESLKGYESALGADRILTMDGASLSVGRFPLVIFPGLSALDSPLIRMLLGLLENGTHVLLESGAAFISPAEFAEHQNTLNRWFDLAIDSPKDLWVGHSADCSVANGVHRSRRQWDLGAERPVPYLRYDWPNEIWVRDFSRAIPVLGNRVDVIGRLGNLPVAARKKIANGILIFLGSPLGPALHAGDSDAQSWLRGLAAISVQESAMSRTV